MTLTWLNTKMLFYAVLAPIRSCWRIVSLSLLLLVLQGGSAFAPQHSCSPVPPLGEVHVLVGTCFHGPLAPMERTPPTSFCFSSLLYGSLTSGGISDVRSSFVQTFLAEQEASGRALTTNEQKWWKRFGELEEYKREHGDCNVPQRYNKNLQLGSWVNTQRRFYIQNKLSSERIEALERIGFEWTRPKTGRKPDDTLWWKRFHELEEYKREHGDCNVPINYETNRPLAKWVMNQRAEYTRFMEDNPNRSPAISADRIELLNSIGFEWRLRERPEWDEMYAELVVFKQTHGNTLVPMTAIAEANNKYCMLARWVNTQRVQYRLLKEGEYSHLADDRIEKLNIIGFVWSVQEDTWDNRLNELKEFKATHGHTDVPNTRENKKLFIWASSQRDYNKKRKEGKGIWINEARKRKLEAIGFEWRSKDTYKWKMRFGELRDFYKKYGVGPIPRTKKTLYRWARRQKEEYDKYVNGEKTNMDEERIKDLESIGFFGIDGK